MPGSQLPTILATIATTLDAITGVQRVHTTEPVWLTPESMPASVGTSQAIDYWTVGPETTQPVRLVGYQYDIEHIIVFRHFYSVGDSTVSTPVLRALIIAVLDAFNNVFSVAPQAEVTGPLSVIWPVLWSLSVPLPVWKTEYRLPVKEYYATQ